jgi:hypothetical protein
MWDSKAKQGSSLVLALGSLLWRGKSHPSAVSPLLLQLLLMCLLDCVKSLSSHTLPVSGGLSVLVHRLLHVNDSDVELAHLLSEGNPTRWWAHPGRQRCHISIGSTRHGPLATVCTSPSRATRTLLVHGLIPAESISGSNPRHVLGRGPYTGRRCGRLKLWLKRQLQRPLCWQLLCSGCSPRCTPSNHVTRNTRTTRFLERNGQWPLAVQPKIRVR